MPSDLERYLDDEAKEVARKSAGAERQRYFESLVSNATDSEFEAFKRRICAEGDAAKARGEHPTPPEPGVIQQGDPDDVTAGMDSFQYAEYLASIGVSRSHVEVPISESLKHGSERAKQSEFDERADRYVRRRNG